MRIPKISKAIGFHSRWTWLWEGTCFKNLCLAAWVPSAAPSLSSRAAAGPVKVAHSCPFAALKDFSAPPRVCHFEPGGSVLPDCQTRSLASGSTPISPTGLAISDGHRIPRLTAPETLHLHCRTLVRSWRQKPSWCSNTKAEAPFTLDSNSDRDIVES